MKEAILLAAGMSSRMGKDKALLQLEEESVIQHVLDKLLQVADFVYIILGENFSSVQAHLEKKYSEDVVQCIYNENHLQGMYSSAHKGFAAVSGKYPIFFQLIDQPFVPAQLYQQLAEKYDQQLIFQPSILLDGSYKAGHPIIFAAEFAKIILGDKECDNLRQLIHQYQAQRAFMLVEEEAILDNLNTPQQFQQKINQEG
ncbi:MAG: nucleotidyltransferase family protein [Candidatus Cloacimonadales bacterium]